ncbi:MAG: 50S ribosomal protein L29 [Candidatus Portnoybacteria bacterium CG03_land_8_20_14_0_80_41_10]|uniref:Large ribosomal subunit protein uL29 n=1 Tax=Candidatus Portnoybacteria bacterium CG03_land_8_20_14_0_80_41_10 TaxID=1974808 RepID=A0A2M7BUP4_9BACT|nr:MAG: 50S ribosomal protein L29 [Candidatus Portnoybacteria bacterium CG03_land_8_20_14_0_80_41_10]
MKIKELRQKTTKELKELLEENRHKLGQLKFDLAAKKLKNVREIRNLRREIARILTILRDLSKANQK